MYFIVLAAFFTLFYNQKVLLKCFVHTFTSQCLLAITGNTMNPTFYSLMSFDVKEHCVSLDHSLTHTFYYSLDNFHHLWFSRKSPISVSCFLWKVKELWNINNRLENQSLFKVMSSTALHTRTFISNSFINVLKI